MRILCLAKREKVGETPDIIEVKATRSLQPMGASFTSDLSRELEDLGEELNILKFGERSTTVKPMLSTQLKPLVSHHSSMVVLQC